MRRFLAAATAASMLCLGIGGCSQPVDPGSPVPSQSQPIVALLAILGLGIGYVAFVHHGKSGSGSGQAASIAAPNFVLGLSPPGVDVAVDQSIAGMVGVLESSGVGSQRFEEVTVSNRTRLGYDLPAGYSATTVTIDALGADWFDDASGTVDKCAAPTSGGPATCSPLLHFSDGLSGAGGRSIAADPFFCFIARDNGAGQVFWAAFSLDGTTTNSGSYTYTGSGLEPIDAVSATTFASGISSFTLFHKDGTSYVVLVPSAATKTPFVFTPLPDISPGNLSASLDGSGNPAFLGMVGTPSGVYELAQYIGTNSSSVTPGTIVASVNVVVNGQINPAAGFFTPPLKSIHADPTLDTFALDQNGALVGFSPP